MKSSNANKLLDEINQTIQQIDSLKIVDPIVLSCLAKYLIVYLCGIYEESIEQILRQKFARVRFKYISTFLADNVSYSFRNPNINNIEKLLERFNRNWSKKIKGIPDINKDAITSLVNIKNDLAHKGFATITWIEAVQYYKDSKFVIEQIDRIVL